LLLLTDRLIKDRPRVYAPIGKAGGAENRQPIQRRLEMLDDLDPIQAAQRVAGGMTGTSW
jgi:hypothetical protein